MHRFQILFVSVRSRPRRSISIHACLRKGPTRIPCPADDEHLSNVERDAEGWRPMAREDRLPGKNAKSRGRGGGWQWKRSLEDGGNRYCLFRKYLRRMEWKWWHGETLYYANKVHTRDLIGGGGRRRGGIKVWYST